MSASNQEVVDALRKTLKERDRLRRENQRLSAGAAEPIAIVGMACRYPGGIASPGDLWRFVSEGRDGISEFPADRGWDLERLYDPNPDNPGTIYTREGGFLHAAGEFDPEFFGISPREALLMDPQERLLLESCWEALEDAGIDPDSLKKSQTGVFAGVGERGYGPAPGMTSSIISGRVSYALGLEGPAISIDTACSSSLVALHLAAGALRQGECTLALAGGVTVLSTPMSFVIFSAQRGLAPDGRCKAFADAADGTGWAEGVGMLVLERLSDAQRNGHPVLALLKGSAVNQDGASNGLTAPNGPSQERVIRQALASANVKPQEVDVVEAHGTGTTLGDPIEAGALLATYGQERDKPLLLGSVKSNIGHTQAAAGVAGVIKMALAMREGVLPKTLHVDAPSSKVDWEVGEIELLGEQMLWDSEGPRRAGVSSFGVSGTNAHVILEQAPESEPAEGAKDQDGGEGPAISGPIPLVLSAKAEPALAEAARRLAAHLTENPELDPTDVAYSLATTRSAFEHRAVALGTDRDQLLESLEALAAEEPSPNAIRAKARQGKLAYLLTGQGSQRLGMGRELYETDPHFKESLDRICEQIDPQLERPLEEILFAECNEAQELLEDTTHAQPALFAIEVALHEALAKRGLKPNLLAGHSVGEIAAAHIAGILDLADAAKLVCARGALMGALPRGGAMAAIEATEQEVADSIEGREAELSIAALNGPTSTVISGKEEAVAEIQALWEERGKKTKRLAVSHAFHSALMEPMLDDFAEVAKALAYHEPKIPIVSNLTGELLSAEQVQDPAYWVAHARGAVRFKDIVESLATQGATAYLELGPDPVLLAMARECLGEAQDQAAFIATLRERRPEAGVVSTAIAGAHAAGAKLEWEAFFAGTGAKRVPLPTYPFQRQRYWVASSAVESADVGSAGQVSADHPLLAAAIEDPGEGGLTLTGRLSLSTHPWLADHVVGSSALLPGTALLELALRAAEQVGAEAVEELDQRAPLILPEAGAVAIQISVSGPGEEGKREIAIHSRPDGEEAEWAQNATGFLTEERTAVPEPLRAWPPEGAEPVEVEYLYDVLAEHGLQYGPTFQGLSAAWRQDETLYAEASLPEASAEEAYRYAIHPALLDSALQVLALAGEGSTQVELPVCWLGVSLHSAGAGAIRLCLVPEGGAHSFTAFDQDGAPLLSAAAVKRQELELAQLRLTRSLRFLHRVAWLPVPEPSTNGSKPTVAILGEGELEGIEAGRHPDLPALLQAVEEGEEIPTVAIAQVTRSKTEDDLPKAVRQNAEDLLALLQAWAREERLEGSRLTVLTEGAIAAGAGEAPDLTTAALWGMVRSAISEHPGRFALVDSDGSDASATALPRALDLAAEEPQLALREGEALAPRLTRVKASEEAKAKPIDPEQTVLITGGLSGIGALIARHLAATGQARHLLLVSRRGPEAQGADELQAELEELGAEVRIAACDVAEREALQGLFDSIPSEHPLGAIVHSAGAIDDGVLDSMSSERLATTMRPKAEAAWHLHELSAGLELSQFIVFSSAAGLLGGAAQANYAAANNFVDALAALRHSQGLPATALAWGQWGHLSSLAGDHGYELLANAEVMERLQNQIRQRLGFARMSPEQGLELFDAARELSEPLLAPVRFDTAVLRSRAQGGALAPILRGLVRVSARGEAQRGSLGRLLAETPESQREGLVLELVRSNAAAVLGHSSAQEVEPIRAFQEMGLDSLGAVELRNRLSAVTGLEIGATVVFDYPSSQALAEHLLAEATASGAARRLAVRAQASEEPIAIVGMACRYPGGVSSPAGLWELVAGGGDGIAEFPADRGWDLQRLYDPDPDHPGTSYTKKGGFLADVGEFDPDFFSISPREALFMDPQERLLLESAWEALEDAGIDPDTLRKTQTGVFAGVTSKDYAPVAGGTTSVLSGRISYVLGMEGPAITVDTACSSSLVALHLAAQALRQGECGLALAGGVTVLSTPATFIAFSAQRGLAPDGRCKSFADAADGTGWAEGVGMLVLERLSEAQRNDHPVLALIKGSAVNQDGASNGLTAPNGPSQERVIRQALANARLEPGDVDAVEAHGTGTTLGDPIEAGALLATYGQEREEPLRLGSLKSNIGHTQAAAGVGGVIKMTMAMREGVLPKTLHVDAPSTKVDWEAGEIELLSEQMPWQGNGRPRRAGVSSFGVSGTNAHVILEQAPEPAGAGDGAAGTEDSGTSSEHRQLPVSQIPLLLSAKSEPALTQAAKRLATHIEASPQLDPKDIAFSLATTRAAFEQRAVVLGEDREELLASLNALAEGKESDAIARGVAPRTQKPVFLFPGQGAQAKGMAIGLLKGSAAFAEQMAACEEALSPHVDWSLREVLAEEEAGWLDRLDIVQPALFAVMVSLAKLWQSCGVRPGALVGHSQGEIAAAHIAGALSLEDAALIIAERGKAMAKIAGKGGMLSVSLSAEQLPPYTEPYGERVSLAAINGPTSLVLSGDPEALGEIEAACEAKDVRAKRIAVDYAAHSSQIEALRDELLSAFAPISPQGAEIPLHSTVTGEQIQGEELGPEYWYRNLRQTVLLEPVLSDLLKAGKRAFIEIGPHPVLAFGAEETFEQALDEPGEASLLATLRREEDETKRFALSLAQAHAQGIEVDWDAFFRGTGAKRVSLPTYPFQRTRYWLSANTTSATADARAIGQSDLEHPLLGAAIEDPDGEGLTLTGAISLVTHPWLADHAVTGTTILPGTAFLEMALRAGEQVGAETVEELVLQAPLVLPEQGAVQLQVAVGEPDGEGRREVSIYGRVEATGSEEIAEWTRHAQGALTPELAPPPDPLDSWPPAGAEPIDVDRLYGRLTEHGLEYGPAFQGLTAAWRDGEQICVEVSLPEEAAHEAQRFAIHPALLDAALHGIALTREGSGRIELPFSWSGVTLQAEGPRALRVRIAPSGEAVGLRIADGEGAPLLSVGSLALRTLDPSQLRGAESGGDRLLDLEWAEVPLVELDAPPAEVELLHCAPAGDAPVPEAARDVVTGTLSAIQRWLADETKVDLRLALVTRGAMAVSGDESPDPAAAAIWGLVRSAQSEHPGRFSLIDSDGSDASEAALAAALAKGVEEPQLALREGVALAARLARIEGGAEEEQELDAIDPERTVLVTGATGGLGALTARHLVERHGARHLLLVSRSGSKAEGAEEIKTELEGLGAEVRIAACDVSDREALAELLDSIPSEQPLGAVLHAAGTLDDGTIEAMTPERIELVFSPKVDAAWNLHELTAKADLSAFVLFSSVAGTLGGPGQSNYAAANVFLDALALRRRAEGLPATSIAWGLWERQSAMTSGLGEADLARMRRGGIETLSDEQGLAFLDAALVASGATALAVPLNIPGLRALASAGALPQIFSGLVRVPRRRSAASGSLGAKLASLPEAERETFVLEAVRSEVALVLGHASAADVEPGRAFKDLGFDSLAAVELRNRLSALTGLRLAATVVFDYPNATALAKHLFAKATASGAVKQVAARAQASEEPIAIVGMACRYPGGVGSPADLWDLVAEGRDGIAGFPEDRGWQLERLYDPDPDHPGTSYVREGGFLGDVAGFDPGFFGISPREAFVTDPQQRLLLEAAWEALEDAGIDPGSLRGSDAGVFAGVMYQDYGLAPGMTSSVVSGRVAYTLGLEGPAITVDTACSSSLVAMHLAAQALRQGECGIALAGGVTVLSTPAVFIDFSRQRGLARDGRSKSFAEAADGAGFSEGVGVLALERLSDAERNGHPVLALIKGSAVNQDGASNGLTAPNGPSQERVIRQALANARLEPGDVDAVEAHGTGTTLGDPIEAGALLATYGQEREEPLRLGSIKSNIGHAQAAAGVAGVIKMTMAMREGLLPKTLHVDAPSTKVDWEAGEIELLSEQMPWQGNGRPRRAGVSSFGVSGTNAHVILEQAPEPAGAGDGAAGTEDSGTSSEHRQLPVSQIPLLLSAKSEPALTEAAERLATHIEASPQLDPKDIAFSLATTRAAFEQRAVVLGEDREQLLASLESLAEGKESKGIARGVAPWTQKPVFLFPGQGAQAKGMATGLLESSAVFAEQMAACEEALSPHVDWSLREVLAEEEAGWLDRLDIVQPALFAVMVSLARLWQECGVRPGALVGHSQGEIAAAHIAGALSLEDAALIIAERGKAMAKIAGKGGMLSVSLSAEQLPPYTEPYGERVSLAAINGPTSLVLSGDPEALAQIEAACEARDVRAKRIAVDYAAHSSQIEALRDELLDAFAPISPKSTEIPLHSTVSAEQIQGEELGPEYWYRNLRQTVLLEPVLTDLLKAGRRAFIEIGPHPVLAFGAEETFEQALDEPGEASLLATLRREEDETKRFALSLAQAHAQGIEVDWDAFFEGTGAKRVPLPTYPFQRTPFWLSSDLGGAGDLSAAGQSSADHPLLGAAVELAGGEGEGLLLTGRISLQTHPWLADHAVGEAVLLPGAALLELALRAGAEAGAETVERLDLRAPLVVPEAGAVVLQVSVSARAEDGRRELTVHSRPDGEGGTWTLHADGALSDAPSPSVEPLDEWPPEGAEPVEVEYLYDVLAEHGLPYGPAFQGLTAAWKDGEQTYVEVSLPEAQAQEADRFAIHPALLDSALHAAHLAAVEDQGQSPGFPTAWSGVSLQAEGARELRVGIAPSPQGEGVSLQIADPTGAPVGSVAELTRRPLDSSQLRGGGAGRQGLLEIGWVEARLPERDAEPAEVEILRCEPPGDASAAAGARRAAEDALEAVQRWLADETRSSTSLALITAGAVATADDEIPDPATAAIWGLIRSAQSEHPGRFALIDSDGAEASIEALPAALAIGAEEPQLALREGRALIPRLARAGASEASDAAPPIDPERTVLVTGATGGLGALTARHLVERHGARRLLLVSRSGPGADGAAELQAELEERGAEVAIAACDVSDRAALVELLASIPPKHPLGAVLHAAGTLADGTVETLGAEQIGRVFAAKVDAAWNLHELTQEADLTAFVLFSSAAGVLGGAGQANYAAANVFLDALALRRRAEGLPATSVAWGLWERASGMTSRLGEADLARMRRGGLEALSDEQGLALLDAALGGGIANAVAMPLDSGGLRAQASTGALPPILAGLVRSGRRRRRAASGSLAETLASLPEAEHEARVLDLVRTQVAAMLGHASAAEIEPRRAFRDLGFDSLAAVELRNRLDAIAGLRLPATVVFDHPSSAALATHMLAVATASGGERQVALRPQASEEPIAIVGMACRYPGGVGSPADLWQLVAEGRDAVGEFPNDRGWDLERIYDPDPANPGTSYTREGGFLADAGEFDPEFFAISPREALFMDPQERLLLEASWEALEDAGIDPTSLRRTPTGVFAGVAFQNYETAAGGTSSIVSGRVSYTLGLEGPAITVDTACSSSLVAMHLAAQALRGGECTLALAGGVTVLSSPQTFITFSAQRGLAPDGRCKSFAEGADGTGWSEGVGVLVLERLSEARRNGHPVFALLKGSAVNQDGASNGITAPNGPSQERVIRQALANARLEPRDVDAVEAHGTGTVLGDPIEAGALLATYGQERETPLRLGSIKSNIGHAQAAAGVAGVIKMTQAMREGVLPKTLHVDAPSSKVEWEAGEIELLGESVRWDANGRPRRAGISSFGISGTNAHVILEQAPPDPSLSLAADGEGDGSAEPAPLQGPLLTPLSARTEQALGQLADRLRAHMEANPGLEPLDLAYSLATTRASLERRAVLLGRDREGLLSALSALGRGETPPGAVSSTAREGKLALLFSGQGSQRAGMGRELYESDPAYADAFDRACEQVDRELGESLKEIVFADGEEASERLRETAYAQPALFAVELALCRTLASRGLEADLLAGHSIGEITAAHVAGVLSLEDAARLVCARGRLMGALPEAGAMLAVNATEQEAVARIGGREAEIAIAAVNSPTSLVLSGSSEAIEAAESEWEGEGRRTKRLAVSHAFHSPLMEPMLAEFAAVAESLEYREPRIPIVSSRTGRTLSAAEATDPAYWVAQVREPVRFAEATATLGEQGASVFLEVGPEPVLCAMAEETLAGEPGPRAAVIPTLRHDRSEPEAIAVALATAHASGAKFVWGDFFKGAGAKRVSLPTYPFQRQRFWLNTGALTAGSDPSAVGQSSSWHPMLGAAIEDPSGDGITLTGRISLSTHPWLADHTALAAPVLPGAAFLDLALHAAERVGAAQVEELTLQAPLAVPERGAVRLQVTVAAAGEDGRRQISIHSRPEAEEGSADDAPGWACHASGELSAEPCAGPEPLEEWPPADAERLDVDSIDDRLAELGLEYGPALQGVSAVWRDGDELFAEASLAEAQREEATRYAIHPALLEAALASRVLLNEEEEKLSVPASWGALALQAGGVDGLRMRIAAAGEAISLDLWDRAGAPLAQGLLRTQPLSAEEIGARRPEEALFELSWTALPMAQRGETSADVPDGLAVLGALELPGSEPERHQDLDALRASLRADESAPTVVICELSFDGAVELPESAEKNLEEALSLLREWIGEERLEASRLVILTREAIAAKVDESPDLSLAPIWGLLRSAQLERPESFILIDADGSEASLRALPETLGTGETQLALREGEILVPRIARAPAREDDAGVAEPVLDPDATVLVTGATSGLGALIVRHLVAAHGTRRLLLVSRSGPQAPGADGLRAELEALGAEARIVACDVADREALKTLIDSIPADRPLGAVVHAAGLSENGTVTQIAPEQVERLFTPKARGAWHLHELTEDLDLTAFLLFSSASALVGGFGIGAYAAANAFLDALAQERRAQGLPATSISWALWAEAGGMTTGLGEEDLRRMGRSGVGLLSDEQGLALFDAALGQEAELALAIRPNPADLRAQASGGTLSPLLQGLVRVRPKRVAAPGSLAARLASLSGSEREREMLELVCAEVAVVLGHGSAKDVDPDRSFQETGFTSIAAIELRNRLGVSTGLRLAPTVVFDYPSPTRVAAHLLGEVGSTAEASSPAVAGTTLLSLLEGANEQGKLAELRELITATSRLRGTFDLPAAAGASPAAARLADGPEAPALVLLPSLVATSGPQEYLRFALAFKGERPVHVALHPGFADGELLPSGLDVAARVQAERIMGYDLKTPFVLVGYSSVGRLTHRVAACLEQSDAALAAVVLLDPLLGMPDPSIWIEPLLVEFLKTRDTAVTPLDDSRMTASMAYLEMLAEWRPQEIATPLVRVRAGEMAAGMEALLRGEGGSFWESLPCVEVPGNHFNMMTDHAGATASAVKDLLLRRSELTVTST